MVPSKFALVALLFTLLAVAVPGRAEEAAAYAVTDSTTGFVLDQYRGDKKLPIGSLTKVATAMVVLDWSAASNSNLDQVATVPGRRRPDRLQPGHQSPTG
ncbi:hypothetical protein CfE428DRAFT_4537 [Chthoniobacter flavus Ellin428]|uniref:Peptidase S11 D-alanyl-D-alanine carboxypeptidase A N-terminal domain-containing protein n=1 Tax=Chthoniobacter flavus Ellin428 TaxID=497964 RepID=B4D6J7_9BACT|nr:hypothetical protein [Chthoniobacter flavus]EDY17798.1 hypothetical protein CfE428DRAFT_4537 [Chthoniobacter flavus Ellin428]